MDMTGQHTIPAPRQTVWEALNVPDVLKRAKETGLAVENGKLVKLDTYRLPDGMVEIEGE